MATTPPADPASIAGGYNPMQPRPADHGAMAPAGNGFAATQPPGQPEGDLFVKAAPAAGDTTGDTAGQGQGPSALGAKMMRLVQHAEASAERYTSFTRKTWARSYRAFRNKHLAESKYESKDYRARSKHFRPKTRSAIRKAMAASAASLFATTDAMSVEPGNEADPMSRAGAELMQEVINYRTDRTSGRNAIPWFLTCMGAVQDATLTGIVVSKQYWKLKTKQVGERPVMVPHPDDPSVMAEAWEVDPATGEQKPITEPVFKAVFDRPDSILVPGDQVIIDSGADWTAPAQSAAFLGIKWPMKIDAIREMEKDPRNPWRHLPESVLRSGKSDRSTSNSQPIRTAREGGTDRYDQTNTTDEFSTIWVTEWYVRSEGEDYSFYCVGQWHLLTEPKTVDELFPWNDSERPIVIGYGALEAHKIFPMSPAESWQGMQAEINDLANLTLDSVKTSIAPIAKVKRGRQVDLEKLRVRAPGTNILMTSLDDVEFDKPQGIDQGAWNQMARLDNDFDGLAGVFDQSSVQGNRQLNETVGGMKLLSGAANTLADFDQRVTIETWAEPALGQIVKLCQYYEHDETVLGLCGERAKLWEKHGVSQITDKLLEAQITFRIDIGGGAGSPETRLRNFQMAAGAAMVMLKDHPKFKSGEYELDVDAVMEACFAPAGFRDGGKRFIKKNPPKGPDPAAQLDAEETKSKIEVNRANANLALSKAGTAPLEAKLKVAELIADLQSQDADRHDRGIERLHGLIGQHHDRNAAAADRHDRGVQRIHDLVSHHDKLASSASDAAASRQHSSDEAEAGRQHQASEAELSRKAAAAKPAPTQGR